MATRTVRGTLTNEGVECQALRSTTGELFTLVGNLGGFKPGDRVVVVGTEVEISPLHAGDDPGNHYHHGGRRSAADSAGCDASVRRRFTPRFRPRHLQMPAHG